MATRVIDDTKLNNIAVAIQAKDSGGQMTVDEMPTRIANIPSGGATLIPKTITQNGVYNASSDNADGYDVVTVGVPEKNTLDEYIADTLKVVNIPSATIIKAGLFQSKKSLTNIIMPNVTSIGADGFSGCTNLALTALPNGITSIGAYAFSGCTNLALTTLPDGITKINNNAFQRCRNLALTALPDGVTSIGAYAFSGCTNLALTALPNGVTSIGTDGFSDCTNLALTALPNGITSIGAGAFGGCTNITYLDFSDFEHIPSLINSNAFSSTSFPFYFRNQQQLDEWAAATNWSSLASRFQIKPSGVI